MKAIRIIIALFCITGFTILMMGCALQDYITPCYIDGRTAEYTEASLTDGPFTSIADAKRLGRELNFVHTENREELLKAIEKDGRLHSFLVKSMNDNLIDARALQETLFAPDGAFGALTGLLGLGAGAVLLKRPGDLRKEDVEEA